METSRRLNKISFLCVMLSFGFGIQLKWDYEQKYIVVFELALKDMNKAARMNKKVDQVFFQYQPGSVSTGQFANALPIFC